MTAKLDPWDFDVSVLRNSSKKMVKEVFGVSLNTVSNWSEEIKNIGAKNDNGSYDIVKIIAWRCGEKKKRGKGDIEGKAELEIEKLKVDIEHKQNQILKIQENFIERSIYHQHLTSFLVTLRNFFEKSPAFHKQKFHMIPADIAEKRLFDYGKMAMDEIANAPEKINA